MARLRRTDSDMTQGSVWKHLIQFALPMCIGLVFQQLYNTVDTIVVGQFVGKEALAAVGSTGPVLNTFVGLATGLSVGSTVLVSQCYGAHDQKRLKNVVHTTIMLTVILSAFMTLAGVLLVEPLLRVMDTPEDVFASAGKYLRIYLAGVSGLLFYNMGSGILRAVGDSRRPLWFLVISAVLNTVFDLLFVVVFHLGVAGVAYATILAQWISALLVMITLCREPSAYGVRLRQLRLDVPTMRNILSIGLPAAVQAVLISFTNVFVQAYINYFGSAAMAGWSAYNKLDAFLMIPMQALATAATTFVGQNYGANDLPRARRGVNTSLVLCCATTAVLAVLVMLFAGPCMRLFTSDPDVIAYGVRFVYISSPFYVPVCLNTVYASVLRSVGNTKGPMIILIFSYMVVRHVYLYIAKMLGNNLEAIALGYPIGWLVAGLLLYLAYRRSVLFPTKEQPQAAA